MDSIRLYKFYDAESALRNISQRRLKISTIQDLNDPFEFNGLNLGDPRIRNAWERVRSKFSKKLGVICFSASWSDPVMWSHYAEKHTGLALGFDVDASLAQKMEYSDSRLQFEEMSVLKEAQRAEFVNSVMSRKFKHWRYEEEYRVFVSLEERDSATELYFKQFSEQLVLREVVLGPLTLKTSMDVVNAFGTDEPLKVITSRLAFRSYNVEPCGAPI